MVIADAKHEKQTSAVREFNRFYTARLGLLRKLSSVPFAAECKRLYVQPSARGQGIADKLLDAQEEFARSQGFHCIYLDSYDDLKAAISLYRKRGYVYCKRYNDNPQATVFLRKRLQRRK